jgi:hypothetical protein
MRSEKHPAAHAVVSPGINQSHGSTVTMADQDWLLDGELRKDREVRATLRRAGS